MNIEEARKGWREVVNDLRPAVHKGTVVPYKPLLLLLLLQRAKSGQPNYLHFNEVELRLAPWMEAMTGRTAQAYLPFWHLQSKQRPGFWVIEGKEQLSAKAGGSRPLEGSFRELNPVGRVDSALWGALTEDPNLPVDVANWLIASYFTEDDQLRVRALTGFPLGS